jgi:hypothetical protein
MQFREPGDPEVVYLESLTGNLYIERDVEIYQYSLAFDHVRR